VGGVARGSSGARGAVRCRACRGPLTDPGRSSERRRAVRSRCDRKRAGRRPGLSSSGGRAPPGENDDAGGDVGGGRGRGARGVPRRGRVHAQGTSRGRVGVVPSRTSPAVRSYGWGLRAVPRPVNPPGGSPLEQAASAWGRGGRMGRGPAGRGSRPTRAGFPGRPSLPHPALSPAKRGRRAQRWRCATVRLRPGNPAKPPG
jgi:hypothetical protein